MSKEEKKPQSKDWRSEVLAKIKAGTTVKIHSKIIEKNTKGEEKQRIQIFEGIVLSRKSGNEKGATITVRKIASGGIGVERIFPIYSPSITKIDLTKQAKVRQAKLYYLRDYNKKLKEKQL
ncbi:MAG: 50S ribosomal protein L19 [Candidatus Buchananbacteria bacterium]